MSPDPYRSRARQQGAWQGPSAGALVGTTAPPEAPPEKASDVVAWLREAEGDEARRRAEAVADDDRKTVSEAAAAILG